MKKLLTFLTISILFASCGGNIAKHKSAIEDVVSKWDGTTKAITGFSQMLTDERSGLMNLSNSLQIAPEIMDSWDESTLTQFNNIQSSAQNHSNNLSSIASEIDSFISSWTEKGKDLQILKDGLVAGKLEGDVAGKITALTTAVSETTSKLDGWKTKFGEIKAAAASAKQMFAEFSKNNGLPGVS